MKSLLTPAGIEQATFRFVARHLNHCATVAPTCNNPRTKTTTTTTDFCEIWYWRGSLRRSVTSHILLNSGNNCVHFMLRYGCRHLILSPELCWAKRLCRFPEQVLCQTFCHRDKYLAKCARVAPKIAWRAPCQVHLYFCLLWIRIVTYWQILARLSSTILSSWLRAS